MFTLNLRDEVVGISMLSCASNFGWFSLQQPLNLERPDLDR